MAFENFIDKILEREGGDKITDDPLDSGGVTKYGISAKGSGLSPEKIKSLTEREAIDIYRDNYYKPSKCDRLPDRLQESFFDAVVNCGISRATKILQKSANNKNPKGNQISVDGRIGNATIKAVSNLEVERFKAFRARFYCELVAKRPQNERFFYGWFSRALKA